MIIGIDNGLDGGIVAISTIAGLPPIAKHVMPTRHVHYAARKTTEAKTMREIDVRALVTILCSLNCNLEETTVYFEHCPFHADRADVMRSMALSAGKILAVLEAKRFKTVRVLSFDWHPVIIGKIPKGQTKAMALSKVRSLWPDEEWYATGKSTVPHTGLVDAALIAEYGRRKEENPK